MNSLRLKPRYWAHDAAERLWHWIYYHRLPEGIEQSRTAAELRNRAYHQFSVHYINSKTGQISEPRP